MKSERYCGRQQNVNFTENVVVDVLLSAGCSDLVQMLLLAAHNEFKKDWDDIPFGDQTYNTVREAGFRLEETRITNVRGDCDQDYRWPKKFADYQTSLIKRLTSYYRSAF